MGAECGGNCFVFRRVADKDGLAVFHGVEIRNIRSLKIRKKEYGCVFWGESCLLSVGWGLGAVSRFPLYLLSAKEAEQKDAAAIGAIAAARAFFCLAAKEAKRQSAHKIC